MGKAILYVVALIIALIIIAWLSIFAILPVAFIILLFSSHSKHLKEKRNRRQAKAKSRSK